METFRQNQNTFNSARERKQANVISILVAVLLICYLPSIFNSMSIVFRVHFLDDSHRLIFNMWIDFLLLSNSLANPLL